MRQILDFNENWWFIHADVDVSEARPGEGELVSLPHMECTGWTKGRWNI